MKIVTLVFALVFCVIGFSQSLPINFEGDINTSDFVDFDGGTATVLANPFPSATNNSATVAQINRDGGAVYAGSKILLADNLDFSVLTKITMKVYTTAEVGTIAKLKLEGEDSPVEIDATTTVSGEWETLEWVFIGVPAQLNELVFMFDFGNIGDGSANSTFYFDDVQQVAGPTAPVPTALPIDFESSVVSTDLLDFSGATSIVIANPQVNGINTSNTVAQVVRDGGQFWAGSKLFLNENLDLSSLWHIQMKLFTTAPVGTRVKIELEGPTGRTSLDKLTTVSGQWETLSWNFDGQEGSYDKINIHFDFGNLGNGSAASTFLFDDLVQVTGPELPETIPAALPVDFEASAVTSDFINVSGGFASVVANPQIDATNPSATVGKFVRSGGQAWAQSKLVLTEFMNYASQSSISMKVYTDAPVGTLLKFKVESTETAAANERNVNTTVSGAWETYTWDFAGDPPVYNVITLMLGYATVNDASPSATFYFDDIEQTSALSTSQVTAVVNKVSVLPNPAQDQISINSSQEAIKTIVIYNLLGQQVAYYNPESRSLKVDVSGYASGIYLAKVSTTTKTASLKFLVK